MSLKELVDWLEKEQADGFKNYCDFVIWPINEKEGLK